MKKDEDRVEEAFVTSYVLTRGILRVKGAHLFTGSNGAKYLSALGASGYLFAAPKDYFFTLEEAKERAEDVRARKIASLKKQLKDLEEATFDVVDYLPEQPRKAEVYPYRDGID